MEFKTKPIYKNCDGSCFVSGSKKCWQLNHIPYAGYLMSKYYGNHAASIIFERYVRMKKILWPEEVENFVNLFIYKHPEIPIKSFLNNYSKCLYAGAYLHKIEKFKQGDQICVRRLFAGKNDISLSKAEGILYGDPFTPKPKDRDKVFFQLTLDCFKKTIKSYEYTKYYEHIQRINNKPI